MKKITFTTTKFLLLAFLLSSGFFMSAGRVEADTQNWTYKEPDGYSNCSAISTSFTSKYYCSETFWDGCNAYSINPTTPPYDIWVDIYDFEQTVIGYKQCVSSSVTYQTIASFSASDGGSDVNTYAPGATVSVSDSASTGAGNTFNGWSGVLNDVLNLFLGSSAQAVGVSAYYGGVDVAHCEDSGSCPKSGSGIGTGSGSFTAPAIPGTYSISLTGCWIDNNYCANSSMSFIVACPSPTSWNTTSNTCVGPPAPTVSITFSFLDKVKSFFSDFLPEKVFASGK